MHIYLCLCVSAVNSFIQIRIHLKNRICTIVGFHRDPRIIVASEYIVILPINYHHRTNISVYACVVVPDDFLPLWILYLCFC